jgi:hypothetical protein
MSTDRNREASIEVVVVALVVFAVVVVVFVTHPRHRASPQSKTFS